MAQSLEGGHRRRHLYPRNDGLLQAAYELAGRTEQRPADRVGVVQASCPWPRRATRLANR